MTEDAIQKGHDYILAQFDQLRNSIDLAEKYFANRDYRITKIHLNVLIGFAKRTISVCEQLENLTKEKNDE